MAGAYPGSSRGKARTHPGQDVLLMHTCVCAHSHTYTNTHTLTHSLRLRQFRLADEPHMHISGMWKKTRVSGENPHRHGENANCTQELIPPPPVINVITKGHQKEIMLFEDLLYYANQGILKFKQWDKVTNTALSKRNPLLIYIRIKSKQNQNVFLSHPFHILCSFREL